MDGGAVSTGNEETRWIAVRTQPKCERLAERAITELHYSYAPWLPTRKALVRGVRFDGSGRRIRSRGDSIVERPLFKGYLLLPLPWDDDGYEVEEAAGVLRIVRYPMDPTTLQRKPKVIRASIVAAIKTAVADGEFDDPATRPKPAIRTDLAIGQRIRTGDNIVAEIVKLDDDGRVHWFSRLFGGAPGSTAPKDAHALEVIALA